MVQVVMERKWVEVYFYRRDAGALEAQIRAIPRSGREKFRRAPEEAPPERGGRVKGLNWRPACGIEGRR
jgi:hypothetical protein